ncbi:MAG TPA: hypothetical protein DEP42_06095 [Ruminococcaceae bacterium]|nr:hypothetical protein [Oscillospiraceae bacterium]
MIDFPNYRRATNVAYYIHAHMNIPITIPIDVRAIIGAAPNIRLLSYDEFCRKMGLTWFELMRLNVSEQGFSLADFTQRKYFILFNDKYNERTIRFTLAHELGHLSLGHHNPTIAADKEANCFARNLLSPAPISNALKLKRASDFEKSYFINPAAAAVASNMLYEDLSNTTKENYDQIQRSFLLNNSTPSYVEIGCKWKRRH